MHIYLFLPAASLTAALHAAVLSKSLSLTQFLFSNSYHFFRGRGMGNVLPAWMTGSGDAAPGSAPARETTAPGEGPIRSVEDALAVLEEYGAKHRHHHKHKKHKHKKEKKDKKEKKSSKKSKKHRHRSKSRGSSSSTGSD